MRRLTPRALGAGIAALGALLLGLALLAPSPFDDRETVRAEFADASGIGVVGQAVRVAGVPVGEITGVERSGSNAVVEMKLDPAVGALGEDATAELRPNLPFEGTAHVELTTGSPSAPALGDERIPAAQTRSYVPVDVALRAFDADVRAAIRLAAEELAGGLSSEGPPGLRETLRGSPPLLADAADAAVAAGGSRGGELASAVDGLSATVDELAAHDASLAPLVEGADRTLAAARA